MSADESYWVSTVVNTELSSYFFRSEVCYDGVEGYSSESTSQL